MAHASLWIRFHIENHLRLRGMHGGHQQSVWQLWTFEVGDSLSMSSHIFLIICYSFLWVHWVHFVAPVCSLLPFSSQSLWSSVGTCWHLWSLTSVSFIVCTVVSSLHLLHICKLLQPLLFRHLRWHRALKLATRPCCHHLTCLVILRMRMPCAFILTSVALNRSQEAEGLRLVSKRIFRIIT